MFNCVECVDVDLGSEHKEVLHCALNYSSSSVVSTPTCPKHTHFQFTVPILSVSLFSKLAVCKLCVCDSKCYLCVCVRLGFNNNISQRFKRGGSKWWWSKIGQRCNTILEILSPFLCIDLPYVDTHSLRLKVAQGVVGILFT